MLNRITRSYYLPFVLFVLFCILGAVGILGAYRRGYSGRTGMDPSQLAEIRAKASLEIRKG